MTKTFATYCIDAADMELARGRLEAMLSLRFVLHESDYWGGDYYLVSSDEFGQITIRRNLNSYTGEMNEPDHPDCVVIVSVSFPPDPEALDARLTINGLRLLNRAVV